MCLTNFVVIGVVTINVKASGVTREIPFLLTNINKSLSGFYLDWKLRVIAFFYRYAFHACMSGKQMLSMLNIANRLLARILYKFVQIPVYKCDLI